MKRFISILTIGVMLFALLPVSLFGAAAYNSDFAGGSGTAQDPYLIATPRQLDRIRNYMDCHFKLICDIEFTDADFQEGGYFYNDGQGWIPLGATEDWSENEEFTGSIDGNGYTIYGLWSNENFYQESYRAGFISVNDGTIQNLTFEDGFFGTRFYSAGAFAVENYGTIYNCVNKNGVATEGNSAGVVVENYGRIENCSNYGAVFGNGRGGSASGIAELNEGEIVGCTNAGNIVPAGAGAGIAQSNYGVIENCQNKAKVSGYSVAGISGYNEGTIRNCQNSGSLDADASRADLYIGGIAGENAGRIEYCFNAGTVSGSMWCYDDPYMYECSVGGIAGYCSESIIDSYNIGTISSISDTGITRSGGITGLADGDIFDCFNKGKISSRSVDGDAIAGGIVGGYRSGLVENCYNVGEFKNARFIGGIVGYNHTNWNEYIFNCYYLNNVQDGFGQAGYYDDDLTIKCTLDEMKNQSTFVGFDFDTVWAIREDEGTPYLTEGHTHTYLYECDAACRGCGLPREAKHSFGEYVYNRDATDKKDGTQTCTCEYCQTQETITAPGTKTPNPFKDVKSNAYYFKAVLWAVREGITAGTTATTFSPNMACDRSQVVTFLWRAAGCPEPQTRTNPFKDVKKTDYYYKAVLWAVEQGITSGTAANTFSPKMVCDRAQIVTFLWRAAGNPYPETDTNPFKDVSYGSYYYSAVLWAVENGITSGTSAKTFSPNMACDRAQIVTFLQRS